MCCDIAFAGLKSYNNILMRVVFKSFTNDLPTIFLLGRVRRVYAQFGAKMVEALESVSGLYFTSGVAVRVGYGETNTWGGGAGYHGQKAVSLLFPKESRTNFDQLALWLMMHELGHRLLEQHCIQHHYNADDNEDCWHEAEHRLLFLFLIDALKTFGEQGERIIKMFPETGYTDDSYGNTRAWRWANALTQQERHDLLGRIITTRDLSPIGMNE